MSYLGGLLPVWVFLQRALNLADLTDKSVARDNLDVQTSTTGEPNRVVKTDANGKATIKAIEGTTDGLTMISGTSSIFLQDDLINFTGTDATFSSSSINFSPSPSSGAEHILDIQGDGFLRTETIKFQDTLTIRKRDGTGESYQFDDNSFYVNRITPSSGSVIYIGDGDTNRFDLEDDILVIPNVNCSYISTVDNQGAINLINGKIQIIQPLEIDSGALRVEYNGTDDSLHIYNGGVRINQPLTIVNASSALQISTDAPYGGIVMNATRVRVNTPLYVPFGAFQVSENAPVPSLQIGTGGIALSSPLWSSAGALRISTDAPASSVQLSSTGVAVNQPLTISNTNSALQIASTASASSIVLTSGSIAINQPLSITSGALRIATNAPSSAVFIGSSSVVFGVPISGTSGLFSGAVSAQSVSAVMIPSWAFSGSGAVSGAGNVPLPSINSSLMGGTTSSSGGASYFQVDSGSSGRYYVSVSGRFTGGVRFFLSKKTSSGAQTDYFSFDSQKTYAQVSISGTTYDMISWNGYIDLLEQEKIVITHTATSGADNFALSFIGHRI